LLDSFEEEASVRAKRMAIIRMIGLGAVGLLALPGLCLAQAAKDSALINTADLDKEIR